MGNSLTITKSNKSFPNKEDDLRFLKRKTHRNFSKKHFNYNFSFRWSLHYGNEEIHVIHYVGAEGSVQGLRYVLQLGADVNEKTDSGLTPFHFAVIYKNSEIFEELAEWGGDYDEKENHHGYTALHYACKNKDFIGVKKLLQLSADVHIKDHHGFTPIDIAKKLANRPILKLLANHIKRSVNSQYMSTFRKQVNLSLRQLSSRISESSDLSDSMVLPHGGFDHMDLQQASSHQHVHPLFLGQAKSGSYASLTTVGTLKGSSVTNDMFNNTHNTSQQESKKGAFPYPEAEKIQENFEILNNKMSNANDIVNKLFSRKHMSLHIKERLKKSHDQNEELLEYVMKGDKQIFDDFVAGLRETGQRDLANLLQLVNPYHVGSSMKGLNYQQAVNAVNQLNVFSKGSTGRVNLSGSHSDQTRNAWSVVGSDTSHMGISPMVKQLLDSNNNMNNHDKWGNKDKSDPKGIDFHRHYSNRDIWPEVKSDNRQNEVDALDNLSQFTRCNTMPLANIKLLNSGDFATSQDNNPRNITVNEKINYSTTLQEHNVPIDVLSGSADLVAQERSNTLSYIPKHRGVLQTNQFSSNDKHAAVKAHGPIKLERNIKTSPRLSNSLDILTGGPHQSLGGEISLTKLQGHNNNFSFGAQNVQTNEQALIIKKPIPQYYPGKNGKSAFSSLGTSTKRGHDELQVLGSTFHTTQNGLVSANVKSGPEYNVANINILGKPNHQLRSGKQIKPQKPEPLRIKTDNNYDDDDDDEIPPPYVPRKRFGSSPDFTPPPPYHSIPRTDKEHNYRSAFVKRSASSTDYQYGGLNNISPQTATAWERLKGTNNETTNNVSNSYNSSYPNNLTKSKSQEKMPHYGSNDKGLLV